MIRAEKNCETEKPAPVVPEFDPETHFYDEKTGKVKKIPKSKLAKK